MFAKSGIVCEDYAHEFDIIHLVVLNKSQLLYLEVVIAEWSLNHKSL